MQKCIIGMAADVAIKITSPPGNQNHPQSGWFALAL